MNGRRDSLPRVIDSAAAYVFGEHVVDGLGPGVELVELAVPRTRTAISPRLATVATAGIDSVDQRVLRSETRGGVD